MTDVREIFKEDLAAYRGALLDNNDELLTIYSNRYISNAVLLDEKENALIGLLLRILAEYYRVIFDKKPKKDILKEVEHHIESFIIKVLSSITPPKIDISQICNEFFDIQLIIRKYIKNEIENKVYRDHVDVTSKIRERLTKLLNENTQILKDPNNRFFTGIINEMGRFGNTHGFNKPDMCFFIAVKSLELLHLYMVYRMSMSPKETSTEIYQRFMVFMNNGYIKKYSSIEEKSCWESLMYFVYPILAEWRYNFIYFTDLRDLIIEKKIPER